MPAARASDYVTCGTGVSPVDHVIFYRAQRILLRAAVKGLPSQQSGTGQVSREPLSKCLRRYASKALNQGYLQLSPATGGLHFSSLGVGDAFFQGLRVFFIRLTAGDGLVGYF